MALFKILKGKAADLPNTYHEGYCYFTTDTGKFYIDISDTQAASSRVELNARGADTAPWSGLTGIPTLVYSVETGTDNGTIKVNQGGTTKSVAVKGLGAAAYKGVTDNSSNTDVTSSDTNLITGRTLYYQLAKKGYTTNTGTVTSITLTAGDGISINNSGTAITSTGTRTITNTGVRSISTIDTTNGTLKVNTNGTTNTVTLTGAPYLSLAGGTVTGATTFNNELAADSATIGNLIVTGHGTFTNGITGDLTGTASNAPWSGITGKPNSGTYVWDVTTGSNNGNITVNLNGTSKQVAVKGLGSNAYTSTSYIPTSEKGAASGVAPLNGSTKIDSTYLPSYVDDVVEYATTTNFPTTGETGKIYLAQDTGFIYRWSGSQYVNVSADTNTTYSFATGGSSDSNGSFRVTPSVGTAYPVTVKGAPFLSLSGGTLTGNLGIQFGDTDKHIIFDYDGDGTSGASWRIAALGTGSSDTNYFAIQSGTSTVSATDWNNVIRLGQNTFDAAFGGNVYPISNNSKTLGTSSNKWSNVYATTFTGNLTGTASGNLTEVSYSSTNKKFTKTINNTTSDIITIGDLKTELNFTIDNHSTTKVYSKSGGGNGSASTWTFEKKTIPNVTAAGSASTWTFEKKTIPNVTSAGSASTWTFEKKTIPNVTSVGSASTWTFESKSIPNVTGVGSLPTLTFAINSNDTEQLDITFNRGSLPTLGTAISVQSKSDGANGTVPTLGTAFEIYSKSGGANGSAPTLGTAIDVYSKSGGGNSTAPTLGTAIDVYSKSGGANGTAPSWTFEEKTVVSSATHTLN